MNTMAEQAVKLLNREIDDIDHFLDMLRSVDTDCILSLDNGGVRVKFSDGTNIWSGPPDGDIIRWYNDL